MQLHDIEEHLVPSGHVAQTFRIKVLQPLSRADGSERFPVLYATDSDDFFGAYAAMATTLQLVGETPRFILVGIGYENAKAAKLLRRRDLYTHEVRAMAHETTKMLAASPVVSGIGDLRTITNTTDAGAFLEFIRAELIPFIGDRYPTQAGEESYFGYSGGGTFGLHTLCTRPETFRRYVLGSPVTSYDGKRFGIDMVRSLLDSARTIDADVFISVGELEEFGADFRHLDLVSGYYALTKFLEENAVQGLRVAQRVFPGETHATAWVVAFNHGLKALFGPSRHRPDWLDAGRDR